jgi:DNA polymerase
VTEVRGEELDWPDSIAVAHPPAWVIATLHPSSVLRSEGRAQAFDDLVADLSGVAAHLVQ